MGEGSLRLSHGIEGKYIPLLAREKEEEEETPFFPRTKRAKFASKPRQTFGVGHHTVTRPTAQSLKRFNMTEKISASRTIARRMLIGVRKPRRREIFGGEVDEEGDSSACNRGDALVAR